VVGANGSGKSTLFDVFGFLHDCLKGTVRQALDKRGRFREVLSREADGDTILIEIQYRMLITGAERLVTYPLSRQRTLDRRNPWRPQSVAGRFRHPAD
jgi:predicted ATPase